LAGADHVEGEFTGIEAPEREEGLKAGWGESAFAIGADVFKKQVAKGDGGDVFGAGAGAGFGHSAFVDIVGAGPREVDGPEGETGGTGLEFNEGAGNTMHGDSAGGFVEGG
jgi:hypothetical protein